MKISQVLQYAFENHYGEVSDYAGINEFMCHAVDDACYGGIITRAECKATKERIRIEIGSHPTLICHLMDCRVPDDYNNRRQFWFFLIFTLAQKGE